VSDARPSLCDAAEFARRAALYRRLAAETADRREAAEFLRTAAYWEKRAARAR
jgi:hypothetical protein